MDSVVTSVARMFAILVCNVPVCFLIPLLLKNTKTIQHELITDLR